MKRKALAVALATFISFSVASCTNSTDSATNEGKADRRSATGVDLASRVTDFTEGFRPGRGYRAPLPEELRTVSEGVGLLLDGEPERARERLRGVDLVVRTFTERASGREYAEVAEASEEGALHRGWGRVYVDLTGKARWSVQVPHPVADANTERIGADVLRSVPGGVLVLAGAHRAAGRGNAADVAHRTDSVFHAVALELVERRLPGLQLHGFADDSAPGFDVIASTGKGRTARPEGRALADGLRDAEFDVCRAWARSCPLAGRTNKQGVAAAADQVPFLHVELSNNVRTDQELTGEAVKALSRTATGWAARTAADGR